MRKVVIVLAIAVLATLFTISSAWAGSPHFVDDQVSVSRTDNSLTVSGKEAGLGNEDQIHVTISVTAACLNPGENFPQAANKETLTAAGDFPVQNGKAYFSLTVTAVFQPSCSPPMTVVFGDVTLSDTTNGLTEVLSGPF